MLLSWREKWANILVIINNLVCRHVIVMWQVVAAWGCDVIIFNPEQSDITPSGKVTEYCYYLHVAVTKINCEIVSQLKPIFH